MTAAMGEVLSTSRSAVEGTKRDCTGTLRLWTALHHVLRSQACLGVHLLVFMLLHVLPADMLQAVG